MKLNELTDQINQRIEDVFNLLEKKERGYSNYKLNNKQYVLLTLIAQQREVKPSELAKQMQITKSAVSQQLAKLEQEEFIVRKQHPNDKRTVTIKLAEKGVHYKEEMEKFTAEIAERYQQNISEKELKKLLETLKRLKEILQ